MGFPLETILLAWLALATHASSRSPVLLGCGFGWVLGTGDWGLCLLGVIFSGTSCWWGRGCSELGRLEPLCSYHVVPQPLQGTGTARTRASEAPVGVGGTARLPRAEGGVAQASRGAAWKPRLRVGGRGPFPSARQTPSWLGLPQPRLRPVPALWLPPASRLLVPLPYFQVF